MKKVALYLNKLLKEEVKKVLKEAYNDDEVSGQTGDISYDQTPWGDPQKPTYDEDAIIPVEKVKQILQKYGLSWDNLMYLHPELKNEPWRAGDLINYIQKRRGGTKQSDTDIFESTPPGREDQVKKLKQELPKTYTDKSGKTKESNPWAVAWSSYNKNEAKLEQLVREEVSKALSGTKNENKA